MKLNRTILSIVAATLTVGTMRALTKQQMNDRAAMGLAGPVMTMTIVSPGREDVKITYEFTRSGKLKTRTNDLTGEVTRRTYINNKKYKDQREKKKPEIWTIEYDIKLQDCRTDVYEDRTPSQQIYRERRTFFTPRAELGESHIDNRIDYYNSSAYLPDSTFTFSHVEYYYPNWTDSNRLDHIERSIFVGDGFNTKLVEHLAIYYSDEVLDSYGNWTSHTVTEYEIKPNDDGSYHWEFDGSQTPLRTYTETRKIIYY